MGTVVLLERQTIIDAIENSEYDLVIDWMLQRIYETQVPKIYGLTLLKREFGKGNPFQDDFLNNLDKKEALFAEYKHPGKRENALKRKPQTKTKKSNESIFRRLPRAVQDELLKGVAIPISNHLHHFSKPEDD